MNRLNKIVVGLALLSGVMGTPGARAECPPQWLLSDYVSGADGAVIAFAPSSIYGAPALFAYGSFRNIGDTPADGLAYWSDGRWRRVPGWPAELADTYYRQHRAMAVAHGRLYVAGISRSTPSTLHDDAFLWCWDGLTWQPVWITPGLFAHIFHMVEFQGELILAGQISWSLGGSMNIVSWTGETWKPLGNGTPNPVNALCVHDSKLFVGVTVWSWTLREAPVLRWDGLTLHPLGNPDDFAPRARVNALVSHNGMLVATGSLRFLPSGGSGLPADTIAWDGKSWRMADLPPGEYARLITTEDRLYAVEPGYPPSQPLLELHEGAWRSVPCFAPASGAVSVMHPYDGRVFVGGLFVSGCENRPQNLLTLRDGAVTADSRTPRHEFNGAVTSFANFGDEMIASGDFSRIGELAADRIAAWNGHTWRALGAGVRGTVHAMIEMDGQLIVAGDLTSAGGAPVRDVARWDGQTWSPMDQGLHLTSVHALGFYQGALVAGGRTGRDVLPNQLLARWSGAEWLPLPARFYGSYGQGVILALVEYDGELYVGGSIRSTEGVLVGHIARGDGTTFRPVNPGGVWGLMSEPYGKTDVSSVSKLTVIEGNLIVGGGFRQPAENSFVWNGDEIVFSRFGSQGYYRPPFALVAHHEGVASCAGETYVTRWSAGEWRFVGTLDQTLTALHVYRGEVFVGGRFTNVNGYISRYFARYGAAGLPADADSDGVVSLADVSCFVAALVGEDAWRACGLTHDPADQAYLCAADVNQDGAVDFGDIDAFVACLTTGGCAE